MAKGVVFHLTHPAILAFPNLVSARAFSAPGRKPGEPRFDSMFMFAPNHPDIPALNAALGQAALLEFPAGVPTTFADGSPMRFKWPFEDGAVRSAKSKAKNRDGSAFEGKYILTAHTGADYPPGLTAVINGVAKDLFGDERAALAGRYFYGGVEVIASFNFVPYPEGNGPAGVTAYIQVITSLNRGERNPKLEAGQKSGSAVHAAAIQAHMGHISQVNPLAGATVGLPGAGPIAVPRGVGISEFA